jgi:tetratricopeptide (TPR) repeat protein
VNDETPDSAFAASSVYPRIDPHDSKLAADFLKEQIDLAQAQRAVLQERLADAKLSTENLKLQNRHVHAQRQHEHLRIALDIAFIGLVAAIVLFFAGLIWQAATSRSVVIEQFDVPPSFDASGLNGKVVAAGLLDRLQALKDETVAPQAKRKVQDAWSGDIRVQIPQANISIGELQRYLHRWLGQDVEISGNVVQSAKGIALTVRGTNVPGKTFEGKLDDLPKLLTSAAEYVYGQSEPFLFEVYLTDVGRDAEAIKIAKDSYLRMPDSDKPWVLNAWGNALEDLNRGPEALEKFRQAVRIDPHFWTAYNNIMYALLGLGQEEAALQAGVQMERAAHRGSLFEAEVRPVYWQNLDGLRADIMAEHRAQSADLAQNNGLGTGSTGEQALDAQNLAQMHDRRGAEQELETAGHDAFTLTQAAFVRGLIAYDRGDYQKALNQFEYVDREMAKSTAIASQMSTSDYCELALAQEMIGDGKAADANIVRGGHFVDCYRFKADILDHRGKWPEALAAYAAAVALAPSLPTGYDSWGVALMRHGDAQGALAKFTQAIERGPHWADPLEHAGEAEAKLGHYDEAAKRFSDASQYAPNWATLYLQWGRALDRAGKHDEALAKYKQAWDLDLTPAERHSIYGCCR